MRSSSAIAQSTCGASGKRPPEERARARPCRPDRRGEGDVDEHEPPGQMGAVLELAERHLGEQQRRARRRRARESRGAARVGASEVAEQNRKREPEDAVTRRGRRRAAAGAEPVDVSAPPPECGPAAVASVPLTTRTKHAPRRTRGRAGRSSSGTSGSSGRRPRRAPRARARPPRRAAPSRAGGASMTRPAVQVGVHGEVAERRLRERAEEDRRARAARAQRGSPACAARRATRAA